MTKTSTRGLANTRYKTGPISPRQMRSATGEVIYAVRLSDGVIKIGWTADLGHRMHKFGADSEILALRAATKADELEIHAVLNDEHRARGREYYRPTAEVLAVVNDMRSDLGLDPIVA